MPDYEALEAHADLGAGIVQDDLTEDLRKENTPEASTTKYRAIEGENRNPQPPVEK